AERAPRTRPTVPPGAAGAWPQRVSVWLRTSIAPEARALPRARRNGVQSGRDLQSRMAGMTMHELKSWPDFFESLFNGSKTFDLRLNDRDYQVGDVLHLREWDDRTQQYTGRECFRRITYVFDGIGWGSITPCKGLARGYAILSLVTSDGGP